MDFRILGAFEVVQEQRSLGLGGARQRLLLARLAVSANRVVDVDALLDELWGGEAARGAKDALQAQVSRARKALGDPARLQARPPGYVLLLDPDELDAARFEALVRRARAAAAGGDQATAADLLVEAEACWRGPALAEFADYPFAQAEAARLEELRLDTIEERVDAQLALGRHGTLTGELQGMVAANPFRERLWAQWMLALYRSGRQTEALRAYDRLRRRLGDELGLEPSGELARLEEAILLHKPELDWDQDVFLRREVASSPAARPGPAPAPARLRTRVLVGRSAERAALLDGLAAATAGHPEVVIVTGDAGIGKTRLVTEVGDAAANGGALVLTGGCADLGGTDVPYAPLAEAFRRHLHSLEPAGAAALVKASGGALTHLVPELAEVDDAPALSGPGRLHGLILRLLKQVAATAPAVLVLEDLHWADPSSVAAIEFVARNLTNERVLILATVRTDELHAGHPAARLVAALERAPTVRRLDLGPLADADAGALVAALVDRAPDPRRAGRVVARAAGNPLFIQELVAGEEAGVELQPTLRELLVTRVERLGGPAIECARLLAVAGRAVSHRLLAEACELAQGELLAGLRQAVERQVVVVEGDAYGFRHALVGEALYDHLLPGERAVLHRRLAAALATLPAEGPAAERAHHWLAAGDAGEALEAHVQAARAAERALAYAEALVAYRRALDLWDEVPDAQHRSGHDHAALYERAGEAAARSERPRHGGGPHGSRLAAELTTAALAHVDAACEPVRAGLLHARLAAYLWSTGNEGRRHAERALALVPASPPSHDRARALADCAQGAWQNGLCQQAGAFAEEAIRLAQAIAEPEIECEALITLGASRTHLGRPRAAESELRAALSLAEWADFPDGLMAAYHHLAAALLYDDRAEAALTVLDDERRACRRLGVEHVFLPRQHVRSVACLRVLGRWDEAERLLGELERQWPQVFFRLHELAFLAGARGDEPVLRGVLAEAAALGVDGLEMQPLYRAQADLHLWLGRPAEAQRVVATALEQFGRVEEPRLRALLLQLGIRAEADLVEQRGATGADADAATARASTMLGLLLDVTRPSDALSSAAIAATADAELARIDGRARTERWRRAVAAWEEAGSAYPLAHVRWRAAEALLLDGASGPEAAALIEASRATAQRLRLAPLLGHLDRLVAHHPPSADAAAVRDS